MNSNKYPLMLKSFTIISILVILNSIIQTFLIPSDPKNAFILGYSLSRWGLIAIMALILVVFLYAAFRFTKNEALNVFQWGINYLEKHQWLFVTAFFTIVSFALTPAYRFGRYAAYYERIKPLFDLAALILILYCVFLFMQAIFINGSRVKIHKKYVWITALIFFGFLLIWLFIITTRIGLEIDYLFWGGAATPVLFSTIVIAFYAAFSISCFLKKFNNTKIQKIILKLIPVFIYVVTFVLWSSEPFTPSFFAPTPVAPNYEYYPYSDAHYYSMTAQSLLAGEGYLNRGIVQRPIYGFLLYIFHLIAGQDYLSVATMQVALFSIFPVLMYFLGKKFYSTQLGLLLGIVSMLRELTALRSTPYIEIVHSKIFMTDFLAAIFVLWMALVSFDYLKSREKSIRKLILLGFIGGLGILVRLNIFFVFIPIFTYLFFIQNGKIIRRLKPVFVFCIAAFVILVPWMTRNYHYTGEFGVDNAKIRAVIDTRFFLGGENDQGVEAETPEAKQDLMILPAQNSSITDEIFDVARFTTAHFMHNEIHSILILPNTLRFENVEISVSSYPYFEETWEGRVTAELVIAVCVNLAFLAFGLTIAFKKHGYIGLIPLAFHVFYNLSNSVGRVSGWRYVMVSDWVIYFYYLLAAFSILTGLVHLLKGKQLQGSEDKIFINNEGNRLSNLIAIVSLAVFSISMLLPEIMIKPKYQSAIDCSEIPVMLDGEDQSVINLLLSSCGKPDKVVLLERALYPRFYEANHGEPGRGMPWFEPLPFNHIGFSIIGPINSGVVVQFNSPSEKFTHYQDVIIVGQWNFSVKDYPYINGDYVYLMEDGTLIKNTNQ